LLLFASLVAALRKLRIFEVNYSTLTSTGYSSERDEPSDTPNFLFIEELQWEESINFSYGKGFIPSDRDTNWSRDDEMSVLKTVLMSV